MISVFVSSYFSKKLGKIGDEKQEHLAKSSTDAYELVKAAKTIRLLGLAMSITKRFHHSTQLEREIKTTIGKVTSKMKAVNFAVSSITAMAIIGIGALFVYLQLTDWGTVVAISTIKYSSDMVFIGTFEHMARMQSDLAGAKRIFAIFDEPVEEMGEMDNFIITSSEVPIMLKDLVFSYDNTPVISDLSLTFKRNKLNILEGKSGVGKSTLMKLILGLYLPREGIISFHGEEELTLKNIRSKTAYVPQDTKLSGGSVSYNIALGNENSTKDDVAHAASLAGADKFISNLPQGYDTNILDDGVNLSGGQKQRILIARALLKKADILLLDEITSALDPKTEMQIMETIKNISKIKTIIFITHKREVARWGDVVYSLK